MPEDREILTIREAAEFLRLGQSTLYRLTSNAKIPCLRLGKSIRFRKSKLLAFLDKMDGDSDV